MSRPGKGNKAPIFCSPLPRSPPRPSRAPDGCKFRFLSPTSGFSAQLFRDATASRREEGGTGGRGRRQDSRGVGGGRSWDPSRNAPRPWGGHPRAGPHRPPMGAAESGRWALPWAQSDKKGLRASLPCPLPRPPQPCLSGGSQVITNPWRGAEAEHLPERHGDDE